MEAIGNIATATAAGISSYFEFPFQVVSLVTFELLLNKNKCEFASADQLCSKPLQLNIAK